MMTEASLTIRSDLGPISIWGTQDAVTRIALGTKNGDSPVVVPAVLTEAARQVRAYLEGELHEFTFPVALQGGDFDVAVWEKTREVDYGHTCTYGWLAEEVGRPRAARAIGGAMGRNRLPLVIPCHRVVAANGHLGGFGCGLHWKKYLLKLEGIL